MEYSFSDPPGTHKGYFWVWILLFNLIIYYINIQMGCILLATAKMLVCLK